MNDQPTEPAEASADDDDSAARLEAYLPRVVSWMRHLIGPGQVVELRALKADTKAGTTYAGTFTGDELPALCRAALNWSGLCQGVYFTLNPLKPERHVRQAPRTQEAHYGQLSHDADILARRWLFIDVDPVRAAGFEKESATDGEHDSAWHVSFNVRRHLAELGFPPPIVGDSGNGVHLFYRLEEDLPIEAIPTPESDPIRLLLRRLARMFNTSAATVDRAVFNPARIVKFPGTLARKGSGEGDRPWRRAKLLEFPTDQPQAEAA